MAVHYGLRVDENELQNYFDSFDKPITMDSFYKSFGIKNEDMSTSKMSKKLSTTSVGSAGGSAKTPQEINDMLRQYAVSNNLSMDDLYRKFDDNKTGIISKD